MQIAPAPPTPPAQGTRQEQLRVQSEKLEAAFLAEMLQYTGLGETDGPFSGGVGEGHFASFLRQEQAEAMVAKGGIGLAEQIFKSLVARNNDHA